MTNIATVVGLIPMAIGIGEGNETNLPPALHSIADRWRRPQPKEEEEVAHAPA